MISNHNLCKFLEWDSAFFGYRIGRIIDEFLTPANLEEILTWRRNNQIDCLYFLANLENFETIVLAEQQGFHLTDTRITLEIELTGNQITQNKAGISIRNAEIEDIEQLKGIASVNHRDSRFYYDGNFPFQKCDELFAVWIEKSCKGFANAVLVAKNDRIIEGYITCSIDKKGNGNIGLVGVNQKSQSKGIGRALITSALDWFGNKNISYITVVTQGRNVKAQRLYQRNGFVTRSFKNWYHLWFV